MYVVHSRSNRVTETYMCVWAHVYVHGGITISKKEVSIIITFIVIDVS